MASKNSSLGSASPAQQNSYHSQTSYDSSSSVLSYDSHRDSLLKRSGKTYTESSSKRMSYLSDDYVVSDSECSDDSSYPYVFFSGKSEFPESKYVAERPLRSFSRGGPQEGIPGAPGSADLEEALRRLTPAAVYARRAALSTGAFGGHSFDSESRTPDSIMSTSFYSGDSFNHAPWKLPDKLQVRNKHVSLRLEHGVFVCNSIQRFLDCGGGGGERTTDGLNIRITKYQVRIIRFGIWSLETWYFQIWGTRSPSSSKTSCFGLDFVYLNSEIFLPKRYRFWLYERHSRSKDTYF